MANKKTAANAAPTYEYVQQDGELDEAITAIECEQNLLLVGPTGSGKTKLVETAGERLGQPVYTIQGSDGAAYEHIIGYRDVNVEDGASVTEWVNGILPRAMEEGAILYCDEPNALPDGIRFLLFSAMDFRREITLAECDGGRVVKAAPGFTVVAAMNEGHGYGGTTALSHAFRDRFDVVIDISYLDQTSEQKLIEDVVGCTKTEASKIVKVATMLRQSAVDKGIKTPVSTRSLLSWGKLIHTGGMDGKRAGEITLVSKVPGTRNNERDAFNDILETVFG